MRLMPRLEYQHFLTICAQIHDCHIQYYSRIQLTIRLLERVEGSNRLKCLLIKKLNGIVEKMVGANQWGQTLFEGLYQNSLACSFDVMETWFCDLALEDQCNIDAFLEQYYGELEGLIAKLCLHYPHKRVPGFYLSAHLKKIMRSLLHIAEQQGRAIRYFEHALELCSDFRIRRGCERFSILIQYCHWSSGLAQKLQSGLNNRPLYRKRGPQ